MIPAAVAIVGAGRVGLTLARALTRSGASVRLLGRTARPAATPEVELDWHDALAAAGLVMIAVPDDAIAEVVGMLTMTNAIRPGSVVLHTSGLHDSSVLEPLAARGAVTGSWHPLRSIPVAGEGDAFTGVAAILEGGAAAVAAGRALAERLDMAPILELPAAGKARYHAAAVFASNYLVVLAEIAARLAREAGAGEASGTLFLPIMQQTLENLAGRDPAGALTGPVRRGDVGTVATHLAVLSGDDRAAYLVLAREALRLAEAAGLDVARVEAMRRLVIEAR